MTNKEYCSHSDCENYWQDFRPYICHGQHHWRWVEMCDEDGDLDMILVCEKFKEKRE